MATTTAMMLPDETVRAHRIAYVPSVIVFILGLGTALLSCWSASMTAAIMQMVSDRLPDQASAHRLAVIVDRCLFWGHLVSGLAMVVWAAHAFLWLRCTTFTMTATAGIMRTGVLSRRTDQIEWFRIRDMTVFEPLWLRIFAAGHLVIYSTDRTDPLLRLASIPDPTGAMARIRDRIIVSRRRAGLAQMT